MLKDIGWGTLPPPTVTSKTLLAHLKKKNPQLYKLVLKLPEHDHQLRQKYERLTTPTNNEIFVQRVRKEKRSVQKNFDIIRQSIDSRKNEGSSKTNEEILKECQSLNIKNIARKYSEYKMRENLEAMQNKIKMQKRHRCLTHSWAASLKKSRPRSCFSKKLQQPGPNEEFMEEVKQAMEQCQQRINTECSAPFHIRTEENWAEEDNNYEKAKLVISSSFERLRQFRKTDSKQHQQGCSEALRNIANPSHRLSVHNHNSKNLQKKKNVPPKLKIKRP